MHIGFFVHVRNDKLDTLHGRDDLLRRIDLVAPKSLRM
jgi:hypothetical protein